MWLCVDRIEDTVVVLVSDEETVYRLTAADYIRLTGRAPAEADVLRAEADADRILSAAFDEAETATRKAAARERLDRLFGRRTPTQNTETGESS